MTTQTFTLKELFHRHEILMAQHKELKADIAAVEDVISDVVDETNSKIRAGQHKDFGTVNFTQDGYEVKHTIPKKIVWDQNELMGIESKILAAGDNPGEYIALKRSVSEQSYSSWPESIRQVFIPARSVSPGRPKIELKEVSAC